MKPVFVSFFLATSASAQVYTPPTPQPTSTEPARDTVVRTPTQQTPSGGLFGNELPFFSPANDLITFNGETWAATDNRLMEARFEKYLNEPEDNSAQAQTYRETIQEILDTISPHRAGGPDFRAAVALLPRASNYPGDARLCDSLSNALYTAMLAKKDIQGTKALVSALQDEKIRLIKENDWKAKHDRPSVLDRDQQAGQDEKGRQKVQIPQKGTGATSLIYAEGIRRITEIEALRKSHQLKTEVKTELAKIQYQALMVQFFLQRRFQHVLMASRFYNQIWKDGDATLYLEDKSSLQKMFSENIGVSPTVSTLDSLASEAIRDVNKGVEAFLFLIDREELESAAKRLAESYVVGEFLPAITTLPREKKRLVLQFVRQSNQLLNALEAKDYSRAKVLAAELKIVAKDFDASRADSAIAAFTRASNMSISVAKNLLAAGDSTKAGEEIRKAAEVWPQNPRLAEFDDLLNASGSVVRARNDFDRLFSEQNYREVVKRAFEFGPAVKDDTTRRDQLDQVVENIKTIDIALVSAEKLSRLDQPYAAWEELAEVVERFPDDPVLNQRMREMAPSVADFTRAIENARRREADGHHGSALAWFYQARNLHPSSRLADGGIKRVTTVILSTP